MRRIIALLAAGVAGLAACGGADGPTPLFGGPVTHSFEAVDDVRSVGELLVFEDCVVLNGDSRTAIYLASGYSVVGPVERATIFDPAGTAVASAGDTVYIDGSTIEGDGGIPCNPERNVTSALIAGALGTCTPADCDDR